MRVEHLLETVPFARVSVNHVLVSDRLNECVDLSEAHLASGDLHDEIGAVVVFDARLHAFGIDFVDDSCHSVLHDELTEHIPHVNVMTSCQSLVEAVKQTMLLELGRVVKRPVVAAQGAHFVLPQTKLLQDRLFVADHVDLVVAHDLACGRVEVDTEVNIVTILPFLLDLGQCSKGAEPALHLDGNLS